jgi:hypothetical protein
METLGVDGELYAVTHGGRRKLAEYFTNEGWSDAERDATPSVAHSDD